MKIYCLVLGELRENCYILVNQDKKALIIDPGAEANKIKKFCKDYQVVGILVTHFHFDHVGALKQLEEDYQLKANNYLGNDFNFLVINTPGHTLDSKTFYFPQEKIMFVGDFLFKNSFGRIDLGGDKKMMLKSFDLIKKYDDEIVLYPGHGEKTLLKDEKENIWLYKKMKMFN